MGELADEMIDGWSCSRCGIYFVEGHGHEVICKSCYKDETEEDSKTGNIGRMRSLHLESKSANDDDDEANGSLY